MVGSESSRLIKIYYTNKEKKIRRYGIIIH